VRDVEDGRMAVDVLVEMDQDPASVGEVYLRTKDDGMWYSIASIWWERQGTRDCEIAVIYRGLREPAPDKLVEIVDRLIRKICRKWGYTSIIVNHER